MVTVGDHPNIISLIGACTRSGMNSQVIIPTILQSRMITIFFVESLKEIPITCLDLDLLSERSEISKNLKT